jgi:hypothetical protein
VGVDFPKYDYERVAENATRLSKNMSLKERVAHTTDEII